MIVVAGAGIIGCAIARELAVRGTRCTVIDPRPVGGGATQASAGMLAPYVEAHERGPLLDLGLRSLELYDQCIAALRAEGHEIEYRRIGTLEIALTPERADELRRGHGEWMEPALVAAAFPKLSQTCGALRNDAHGYVDALQLARALAASAGRHGARFVEGRIERIEPRGGHIRIEVGNGEAFDASTLILAAGAWTNRIEGIPTPPLRPVRGQLLHHGGGIGDIQTILWGPDCYIVPRERESTLLIGATVEEVGFDERSTDEGVTQLFDAARRLLRPLQRDMISNVRVGLRPATPDGLPVIGRDPRVAGLVHASGHYRNGVLLAPITGKLIAEIVIDDRSDPALRSFDPGRFNLSNR